MAALASMHWTNTFFAHWQVPAAPLASHLPAGLALDLHRGRAWVSIAAMRLHGPVPGPFAPPAVDPVFGVDQVDVRTYVLGPEGPGIFILESTLNGRVLALFGRQLGLPYRYHRSTHVHRGRDTASVLTSGLSIYADLGGTLRPGPLESRLHFLTERYLLYTAMPGGVALGAVTLAHEPWKLRRVELATALPSSVAGFPGAADPAFAAAGAEDLHVRIERITTHPSPLLRETGLST